MKTFQDFSSNNGLHWVPNSPNESFSAASSKQKVQKDLLGTTDVH